MQTDDRGEELPGIMDYFFKKSEHNIFGWRQLVKSHILKSDILKLGVRIFLLYNQACIPKPKFHL